jgi:hypothetical protein
MKPVAFQIKDIQVFQRAVTLRLPFRFGAATVTACPQAFAKVTLQIEGVDWHGASAELMVPKWFDKSPQRTQDDNFDQLRLCIIKARDAYLAAGSAQSAYSLSAATTEVVIDQMLKQGHPRLVGQFGPALLDKAIADAVLRSQNHSWVSGLGLGLLGDPWSGSLKLHTANSVWLRHTVGLADRLTDAEPLTAEEDGLPNSLTQAIEAYGLKYFKLKVGGNLEADIERLAKIEAVLSQVQDYKVTLDGNETFQNVESLSVFVQALSKHEATQRLLERTLLIEQPLPRAIALEEKMPSMPLNIPVILDESDDHPDVLAKGLALGYRGISSKACKGIYRSLHSASLVQKTPQCLLSGEDLTCQAGLGVQQDSLLATSLGVQHIERNGHHYVKGFGVAPLHESNDFAKAHADLYTSSSAGVHLKVQQGQINIASLHQTGFGHQAWPDWQSLDPISIKEN